MKSKFLSKMIAVIMAVSIVISYAVPVFAEDGIDTSDFDAFVSNLEVLENYSHDYVQSHTNENETLNVINYVRTGVAKYTTGSWTILAGDENTDFTQYVAEKDAENNTTASALKSIKDEYTAPNGDTIDFRHMFGSMDVAYYSTAQGASKKLVQARADLSSWAGDVCDLMLISDRNHVSGTVEEMADLIRENYLGENYDYAFGQDDIYGDLDSFYILSQLDITGERISTIMKNYFTASLTDKDRADYFIANRLDGVLSKNDIRTLLYRAYTKNQLMYSLESSRSLQNKHDLRTACIYAFADYIFELGGDPNAPDTVGEEEEELADNEYYSVFSTTSSNLAPGIKQDIKYAITKDNKQIVYYLATVDINRDDVNIYANYNKNDPSAWAMARTTDQMAAIQAKHSNPEDTENYIENYNTIIGTNGDFYNMSTGKPTGALVMNGVQYADHNYRADRGFFAILKDGTPVIGSGTDWDEIAGDVQEAVGGSVVIIKNGELVNQTTVSDYYGSRAPRTCIGITSDGKLIMMVLDGRQEPFSAGGNIAEIAQIMLDAGCVEAINLDGGGSSTFAAKQEGSDEVTIVNRPSDGYERSVSSSLVVVSTAEPSNKFDHVLIETDTDYLTVGSSVSLNMNGVSTTGNSADIPEDAVYQLSDESIGHIENGSFYADSQGEVVINAVSDGEIIGTKTLFIVTPDRLYFTKSSKDVIYGKTITLPICATYNGNAVTINPNDVFFQLSNNAAGTFDGFDFTAAEDTGINNITVTALLNVDFAIKAQISISIYDEGAAVFDFENAMAGDRQLSWNRYVSNSTTLDNKVYYIVNQDEPMTAEYTFGIDMRSVPIPSQLLDLLYMVAGGDIEGATAWMFLLELAERVSPLTNVCVTLNFHQDVDVDISDLTIVSDYFTLDDVEYDPVANQLVLKAYWIKQSAAIKEEVANPICIVSGIKVTPRDNAYWENDTDMLVPITGKLHYLIGLRSSQLYNMSSTPEFQDMYGIYNYDNSANLANDKGGYFEMDYLDFEDTYQLNKEFKQGWKDYYGKTCYFVDNKPLTGIQLLPDMENPSESYYFDLGEDGNLKGKYTGFITDSKGKMYSLNGKLKVGWTLVDDDVYYFAGNHYAFVNKTAKIGDPLITCVFDKEGHLVDSENYWYNDGKGIRYYWAGKALKHQFREILGKTYFFDLNQHIVYGIQGIALTHGQATEYYLFDTETGELITKLSGNGIQRYGNYVVNLKDDVPLSSGLMQDTNGDYYYFNSKLMAVRNCWYGISEKAANGLLPAGKYYFGEDSKLHPDGEPNSQTEPENPEPSEKKNGIVLDEDGELRYYVDDVAQYYGLAEDDLGYYYYFNSTKKAVKNCVYGIGAAKTNGLLPAGKYEFDNDGRIIGQRDESKIPKSILTFEEDGSIRYYVDGVPVYYGLIQDTDGSYYYINSTKKAVKGCWYGIGAAKTNGLLEPGKYYFGADGKLNFDGEPQLPELKNGIVHDEDGEIRYYVNDVAQYYGLARDEDGSYYYFNSTKKAVKNCVYGIGAAKTNGLLPAGKYSFDENGKLINPPSSVK